MAKVRASHGSRAIREKTGRVKLRCGAGSEASRLEIGGKRDSRRLINTPYVKLAQTRLPENSIFDRQILTMSFPDLLAASHLLSIAQNERRIEWDQYSPAVQQFAEESMNLGLVNENLAKLNRRIVSRMSEVGVRVAK